MSESNIPDEVAADLSTIEAGLSASGDTDFVPPSGGGPEGSASASVAPGYDAAIAGQMGFVVSGLAGVVAARRGDHWLLAEKETEDIGIAAAMVMEKYLPNLKGGPEWMLVAALAAPVVPRLMIDRQKFADKSKASPSEAGPSSEGGGGVKSNADGVSGRVTPSPSADGDAMVPADLLGGIDGG